MAAMTERLALPVIAVLSLAIVGALAVLLLGAQPAGVASTGVAALPALNAALNASSALLLGAGYVFIRRRRITAHRACMLAAASVSTAFLVSYVVYHWLAGSRPFTGTGLPIEMSTTPARSVNDLRGQQRAEVTAIGTSGVSVAIASRLAPLL